MALSFQQVVSPIRTCRDPSVLSVQSIILGGNAWGEMKTTRLC